MCSFKLSNLTYAAYITVAHMFCAPTVFTIEDESDKCDS